MSLSLCLFYVTSTTEAGHDFLSSLTDINTATLLKPGCSRHTNWYLSILSLVWTSGFSYLTKEIFLLEYQAGFNKDCPLIIDWALCNQLFKCTHLEVYLGTVPYKAIQLTSSPQCCVWHRARHIAWDLYGFLLPLQGFHTFCNFSELRQFLEIKSTAAF